MFPSEVRDASEVLISGPLLSGKRMLFHRLLREWADDPVVAATRQSAGRVRSDHDRLTEESGEELVVIDCVSAVHDDVVETSRTKYAAGPGNLTSIGTTFTEVLDARCDREDPLAVGLETISPLLMYSSIDDVYRFVRLLIQQGTGEEWPVVAVVESEAHDRQIRHTLREPFDVIVETRIDDGARQFRTRSRAGGTEWAPIEGQ